MSSKRQLKRAAIISYLSIGINIVIGLLYTPWMVREIGQANYGLYTLASSFITLFMLDFGISGALSRYLSKYRAEQKQEEAEKTLGATYLLYLIIDIIAFLILSIVFIFLEDIYAELSTNELELFKILFLIVAFYNIISFPATTQNGILISYEKLVLLKACELVHKFLTIFFVIIALTLDLGVIWVVIANVGSGLITITAKYVIIKRTIPLKPSFDRLSKQIFKSIFSISVWVTIISLAQRLIYNMAPSVLGIVAGSIAISIYAPASTLGGYFYVIASAINGLFLPYISRKVAENRINDIQQTMNQIGRYQFIILGWVVITFIGIGKHFMILWMGKDFELSYYCGILIFLPALFEYAQQIGNTTILVQNQVKIQAIGFSIIGIIIIIISFLLGKIWGAVGVCISISLGGFANVMLQSYIFSTRLKLNMIDFFKKAFTPMLFPYMGTIIIGLMISYFIPTEWLSLIISIFIISLVYAFFCLKFVLSRNEIRELLKI